MRLPPALPHAPETVALAGGSVGHSGKQHPLRAGAVHSCSHEAAVRIGYLQRDAFAAEARRTLLLLLQNVAQQSKHETVGDLHLRKWGQGYGG